MSNYYNRQWRLPNNENKDKQSNYSLSFDASSSQYITTTASVNGYSSFTISAWAKADTLANADTLLGQWRNSNTSNSAFLMYVINTTTMGFYIGSGSSAILAGGNTTLSTGQWYHFCATWDGTTTKLYINGVQESTTGSASSINTTTVDLLIGAYNNNGGTGIESSKTWNGQIDAVSIYDYALPATGTNSVATLYGSSSTGIGNPMSLNPKPVAMYNLGDKSAFNGANYLVPNSSLKDYVFSFDGSNDYINFGNDSSLQPANAISISAWVNFSTVVNYGAILFTGNGNGNSGCYLLTVVSNKFYFYIRNTSWVYVEATGFTITTGTWIHLVATYDKQNLKLYVNNSSPYTQSETNSILYGASSSTKIGTYNGNYFNGSISNAQIFNTALPATGSNSVETLYNNGSPLTSMSGFSSLQGWWKLDASATYDSSTTTWSIPDDSTNSNDGTSSGMTQANLVQSDLSFKTSYSPYALDFDGTNDYINVPNNNSLDFGTNTDFTLSMWVKRASTGNFYNLLFNGDTNGAFWWRFQSDDTIRFFLDYGSTYDDVQTTATITDSNWHHLVAVADRDTQLSIYIDGQLSASNTVSNSGSISTTLDFKIGARYDNTQTFSGSLSNCSVWNAALSSAQVSEIYSEGVPSNLNNHSAYANLVSWWQLGSNSSFNTNWTVLNEISTGSNGTSVNMTEADIVDGVGSYANGLSSGMGGDEVTGDAPYSTANSLSVNMDVEDRVSDTPS